MLTCPFGLAVNIITVKELFAKQNGIKPDCNDDGYEYNYMKPFIVYCNGREACPINAAFLNSNKLFQAETYFLPDDSFYVIPYRIDISYSCQRNYLLIF
jgi:hypothetical protein